MVATPEVRTTQTEGLAAITSIAVSENTTQLAALAAIIPGVTSTENTTQLYALTAINFPSPEGRTTQAEGLVVAYSNIPIYTTQAFALVAVKLGSDDRTLRAWTFTQDDHDFYVLQLGNTATYVYDKLSTEWFQWISPDAAYWRGSDGCDWEGFNVACDFDSGKIFKIDPNNRLDYNTTPIVSQVFGGMTERFRNFQPCFMAEVAISQGRPPAGIVPSSVGIRLRTSDTVGIWTDHGTITGLGTGLITNARFYGLGLMKPPAVLFEITDYGYARRIDGLNIEMGGKENG